jgi:predicted amidophosphoribosyltransferase
VEEIIENMAVDENLSGNLPTKLVLFDDVLTTGAHFKAAKQVLMKRFGQISVIGIFIARRCFPTTP